MLAIEYGRCDVCGKENQLHRMYIRYPDIKCACHSPCHFDLVMHCKDCTPKVPEYTKISLKTDILKVEVQ